MRLRFWTEALFNKYDFIFYHGYKEALFVKWDFNLNFFKKKTNNVVFMWQQKDYFEYKIEKMIKMNFFPSPKLHLLPCIHLVFEKW